MTDFAAANNCEHQRSSRNYIELQAHTLDEDLGSSFAQLGAMTRPRLKSPSIATIVFFASTTLSSCALEDPSSEPEHEAPMELGKADSAAPVRLLWPNGDVYLILDTEDPEPGVVEAIHQTAEELSVNTGIRLHLIDDPSESRHGYWDVFSQDEGNGTGGSAPVGIRRGGAAHSTRKSVRHEIGHIVGLKHTQTRADRAENVTFHESFVDEDRLHNFRSNDEFRDVGPYDAQSIMHYSSSAFSTNGCATLSMGRNDPTECVRRGDEAYIQPNRQAYTKWNYSVLAALYCEPELCGDQCASTERCDSPAVQEHLVRLAEWNAENDG